MNKATSIPEQPIDVRQDGIPDERPWVKPAVPAEGVQQQLQQGEIEYGEVGFNPMARDPITGELLHKWPPQDDAAAVAADDHEGSTQD